MVPDLQRLSGEVECRPKMPKLDYVVEIDQPKEKKKNTMITII